MSVSRSKCRRHILLSFSLIAAFAGASLHAETSIEAEAIKVIRAPLAVGKLGPDLFGDKVNFYNGGLEFVQTDVSLPGNSKLPVSVGRRLSTGSTGNLGQGLFAHWDLDIPSIQGTFSAQYGWTSVGANGQPTTARCSNFGAPPEVYKPNSPFRYRATEYWHGHMLSVPGGGDEILRRDMTLPLKNTNVPSDGQATLLVTRGLWAIRCLGALASNTAGTPSNETGEGFLGISPDGTQYRFDWLVSRPIESISKIVSRPYLTPELASVAPAVGKVAAQADGPTDEEPTPQGNGVAMFTMSRTEVAILPTVITDRFGNTVRYVYDTVDKWKVLTITSADGAGNPERKLTFTYLNGGRKVQTVSDGTRTWTYGYRAGPYNTEMLHTVTLPDGSKWDFSGMGSVGDNGMLRMELNYIAAPDQDGGTECDPQVFGLDSPVASGYMVHPSGATGHFQLTPTQHGRNGVPKTCYADVIATPARAFYPRYYDSYALTKKVIAGPGMAEMHWTTAYSTFNPGWECASCGASDPHYVYVTNPKGEVTRYTFGNTFGKDEGLVKQVDIGWNSGNSTALRTTVTRYSQSFTDLIGISAQPSGDMLMSARHIPVDMRKITQQGVDFTWLVPGDADFDIYRRPLRVTKSSSLGMSKTESTLYHHNTAKWVIGQVTSVTESSTGKKPVENFYDATASLESVRKFGRKEAAYAYYADGTLSSSKDGRNNTTRYANYKRGVPRLITYPDARSEVSGQPNHL